MKPQKKTIYQKICRRCGNSYPTESKYSLYCKGCHKPTGWTGYLLKQREKENVSKTS